MNPPIPQEMRSNLIIFAFFNIQLYISFIILFYLPSSILPCIGLPTKNKIDSLKLKRMSI